MFSARLYQFGVENGDAESNGEEVNEVKLLKSPLLYLGQSFDTIWVSCTIIHIILLIYKLNEIVNYKIRFTGMDLFRWHPTSPQHRRQLFPLNTGLH